MDWETIKHIIAKGENTQIEFKEAKSGVPHSFYETVISFSNTDGGTIFLGVNDDGKITGIDSDMEIKLKKDIITALNNKNLINPPVYVHPKLITTPEGNIITIQIPASSQLHSYKGHIYIREFDVDIDITDNQQKISDIYLRKRNFFTETIIYPFLSLNDLDDTVFEKALNLIRNIRSDHPWLYLDKLQILKDASLWRKDYRTGEEGFTLAAALIFGKDVTIQSILPAYKVEAMVRIHNKDRYDDRINPPLRTNLIDTYLELKSFIYKYLPEKFYTEKDQRIDLRDKIFREVIANAIVHREYTSAVANEIIITDTEVVIKNPNKPVFYGYLDPSNFNPYPKNPNIRKFFTALGWTDEIGSGIRNTYKYLPLYVPNAKPVFIEQDIFTTIIPLHFVSLELFAKSMFEWLELDEQFLMHFIEGASSISLNPELHKKNWTEVLLELVPSWHKKGTQLNSLKWDDNQIVEKDEIKKVPSWDKKSTRLLKKKNRYLIGILSLCSKPASSKQLMKAFNYKNEKVFRDNYLKPLRESGLIEFTIPDNPNDPNNKYKLTHKGKTFLSGI